MKITISDVSCAIDDPMALPIIRQICRARPDGFQFMQKYKMGFWDGYVSLMYSFRTFPIGLLDIVVAGLVEAGHAVELEDTREVIAESRWVNDSCLRGVILRDYQVEAANVLIEKMNGIAKMATNSGKTEVMAAIIWGLQFPKTLIIIHRKELLYQTAQRLSERLDEHSGLIGDGFFQHKNITIAMIQTLSNKFRAKDWVDNQVVMIDECHHISSNQMMDVLKKIPGAYRFGFSGTPLKYDKLSDMKLISATGEIRYDISNKDLIEEGYSAVPDVKIHVVESHSKEDYKLKYADAYDKFIVNNDVRNSIIASVARESTGVTLILVNRIDHGEILLNMIPNSIMIDGSDSTEFRKSVLEMMKKDAGVYISSPILDEGVDVPALNVIILAGGGKSNVKLLQRIGRGLRKKDDNSNVLFVHDFLDDTNIYLLNHSAERVETYVKEGFRKSIIQNKS